MKKDSIKKISFTIITVILFAVIAFGCDEIPSEYIDSKEMNYQVTGIDAPEIVILDKADTTISISLEVANPNSLNSLSLKLISPDNKTIYTNIPLTEKVEIQSSDNKFYIGSFDLDSTMKLGKYRIDFNAVDIKLVSNNVAVHYFQLDNGEMNFPPVLIDSSLTAPDSIKIPDEIKTYLITIQVEDANGLDDLKEVYIDYYFPDGTKFKIVMSDDGSTGGDQISNDGIYTIRFTPTEDPRFLGDNRFEFFAVDSKNQISNKVVHNVVIYK